MAKMTEAERRALAAEVKAWRGKATLRAAASVMGLSDRTLEGVEAARGFNYPTLLRQAMKAWEAPQDGK